MKYWLLIGVKDAKTVDTVRANLYRQRGSSVAWEPIFVETGEVRGTFSDAYWQPEEGVLPFLELAFFILRQKAAPGDWWVRLDADDYYGASYLDDIEEVRLAGADATGIPSVYVRSESNQMFFCRSRRAFTGACGGTLAGDIAKTIPFRMPAGQTWGEDTLWVEDMIHAGHVAMPRRERGYSLVRSWDLTHTYPIKGYALPHVWSCDALNLGTWTEEKADQYFSGGVPIFPDARIAAEGMQDMLKKQYG